MSYVTPCKLLASATLIGLLLAVMAIAQPGFSNNSGEVYREVQSVSFSPDGRKVAVVGITGRDSGVPFKRYYDDVSRTISLLDAGTPSHCTVVEHEFKKGPRGPLNPWGWPVAFAPNGQTLFVANLSGGTMRAWDIDSERWEESQLVDSIRASALEVSHRGNWVVYRGRDHAGVVNVETKQKLNLGPDWKGAITQFSSNGKRLVVIDGDKVQVWDLEQQQIVAEWHQDGMHISWRPVLALSPTGTQLALRCGDGTRLFEVDSKESRVLSAEHIEIKETSRGTAITQRGGEMSRGARYAPDGSVFVLWGDYGIKFFDVTHDYRLLRTVAYHVTCFAFSPDGKTYATGDRHGALTLFKTSTDEVLRTAELRGDIAAPDSSKPIWRWPEEPVGDASSGDGR